MQLNRCTEIGAAAAVSPPHRRRMTSVIKQFQHLHEKELSCSF